MVVELTNPLMYDGRLIPSGTKLRLDDELAKNLINNGNAVIFSDAPIQELPPDPSEDPDPEIPQELVPEPIPIPMGRRLEE